MSVRIGFFDSGVGGLTIIEPVHKLLPEYDTLYLGDTARAPYGDKSHEELVSYTTDAVRWLFAEGCELVIIACNSASARALREIQRGYLAENHPEKRVLGIVHPSVELLSSLGYKNIAVLSTPATKKSLAYPEEFRKLDPTINIISHACPNWAKMIEQGLAESLEMKEDIKREIEKLEEGHPDYDAVLLACTHYPYIAHKIASSLSKKVPIFNQGPIVADSLKDYLSRHPEIETKLGKNYKYEYFVTKDAQKSSQTASDHFGFQIDFNNCSPHSSVLPVGIEPTF